MPLWRSQYEVLIQHGLGNFQVGAYFSVSGGWCSPASWGQTLLCSGPPRPCPTSLFNLTVYLHPSLDTKQVNTSISLSSVSHSSRKPPTYSWPVRNTDNMDLQLASEGVGTVPWAETFTCGRWHFLQVTSAITELHCRATCWCHRIARCGRKKNTYTTGVRSVVSAIVTEKHKEEWCRFSLQKQLVFLFMKRHHDKKLNMWGKG